MQFPVVPCEALTIHKSQGQTYDKVCIDLSRSKNLSKQLLYVALSRVTKLSGLYILGNFREPTKSTKINEFCNNELKFLRTEMPLKLSFNNFKNVNGLC